MTAGCLGALSSTPDSSIEATISSAFAAKSCVSGAAVTIFWSPSTMRVSPPVDAHPVIKQEPAARARHKPSVVFFIFLFVLFGDKIQAKIFCGFGRRDGYNVHGFLAFNAPVNPTLGWSLNQHSLAVKPIKVITEAVGRTGFVKKLDLHFGETCADGGLIDAHNVHMAIQARVGEDALVGSHLLLGGWLRTLN
jgi:hypothetical protein